MEVFGEGRVVCFAMEQDCETGIYEIAQKVAGDMELVSGSRPDIVRGLDKLYLSASEGLVLFATAGKSEVLEQLERKGLIDLSAVRGKNEVYACFLLENSENGVLL